MVNPFTIFFPSPFLLLIPSYSPFKTLKRPSGTIDPTNVVQIVNM